MTSDNAYFSIFGTLKKSTVGIYYIQIDEKNYRGRVAFKLDKIANINNNIIALKSNNINSLSTYSEELFNKISQIFLNKNLTIIINDTFYKDYMFPTVEGKLKYNSKEKIFYLQNYDLTIQCRFNILAVKDYNIRSGWININI